MLTNQRWGLPERAPGARVMIRRQAFILHRVFPKSVAVRDSLADRQERGFDL